MTHSLLAFIPASLIFTHICESTPVRIFLLLTLKINYFLPHLTYRRRHQKQRQKILVTLFWNTRLFTFAPKFRVCWGVLFLSSRSNTVRLTSERRNGHVEPPPEACTSAHPPAAAAAVACTTSSYHHWYANRQK